MKLTVRLWRWWREFWDENAKNTDIFVMWALFSLIAVIVGIIIGGLARHSLWIGGSITSIPTITIWGSLLSAALLDSIVGLWRGWSWLLGKAFTGVAHAANGLYKKAGELRVWLRSDDGIFEGNINPKRFEPEHLTNVETTAELDPLAVVTEFVRDQRRKPLSNNEKIVVKGFKIEGENMSILFVLSQSSITMSNGVKEDHFSAVVIELMVHFVPITNTLHIRGASPILLNKLGDVISSVDLLVNLSTSMGMKPDQSSYHTPEVLTERNPQLGPRKVAC